MRICLLGHFGDRLDEGVRNISRNIFKGLDEAGVDVIKLDISRPVQWKEIQRFEPDIIHFIIDPTPAGLFVSKLISSVHPGPKSIISAIHPAITPRNMYRMLRPDAILTQSSESEEIFSSLEFNSIFLPNGVDIDRFRPLGRGVKYEMRDMLGIGQDDFVVLHLASLKTERNLEVFCHLEDEPGCLVLIIGREHEPFEQDLVDTLRKAGCQVLIRHFPDVEVLYTIADCYVFPTINSRACIETPLSVIEAMACNLPVITTRFGSLPRLFSEGNGLFFAEDVTEIPDKLRLLQNQSITVSTRQMVLPYAWTTVIERLLKIYEEILC